MIEDAHQYYFSSDAGLEMSPEQAGQLLAELGKLIGVTDLVFDEDSQCLLAFDDLLFVSMRVASGKCTLLGMILDLTEVSGAGDSEEQNAAFLRKILAWNLELTLEGGTGTIALDESSEALLLACSVSTDGLTATRLYEILSSFIKSLDQTIQHLSETSRSEWPEANDQAADDQSATNREQHQGMIKA